MSEWVGIEDTPPVVARPAVAGGARTGRRAAAFRVRREERIVLGAIDRAGAVLRLQARAALVGGATFLVPVIAVSVAAAALAFDRFDTFSGSVLSVPELAGGVEAATGVETVLAYFGVVFAALAAALVGGYAAALLVRHDGGRPVDTGSTLRSVAPRLPALFAAWIVGHGWVLLVALAITGTSGDGRVALLLVLLPLGALLSVCTLLVSPALVVERLGVRAALRRSFRLVRARFSAAIGLCVGTAVIGSGLRLGIATLPRLATETGLVTFGPYGWLVEGIAGQVAQLVAVPLVALATAEFYLQVRMHAEGLDLVIAADTAFAQRG